MKKAVIIGAGPAGLTAALELLRQTEILPLVFESDRQPGGISKTIVCQGFRMDIGGHRFFSKSDRVMKWWFELLPPAGSPARDDRILGREIPLFPGGPDPETCDRVMLVRKRLSRILFEHKFYPYPLNLSVQVIRNLGLRRTIRAGVDYLWAALFPRQPEKNLEDFLINRFGHTLYELFFRDYTYKIWGRSCREIEASWGRQRIKGLSFQKVLTSVLRPKKINDISQKETETTLINYFLYPKFGPGQLWEEVVRKVEACGGQVFYRRKIEKIFWAGRRVIGVLVRDLETGKTEKLSTDYVISSAPVRELLLGFEPAPPQEVQEVARALPYRDFITVGVCLEDAELPGLHDNWIYVQEPDVKVGRLQLFHNWSPYLVPDKEALWLGLEFFANEGDELWRLSETQMKALAVKELLKLGIIRCQDWVRFMHVAKVKKAYPAYWDGYQKFSVIRNFIDRFENLFLVGRNGMHRYNNQDHSMLAAMEAVRNIAEGIKEKDNIWMVNTEAEYHEAGKWR